MRYMMLLSFLAVFGVLVYFMFTSKHSIFSPESPGGGIENINTKLDSMQSKVDTYNEVIQDAQNKTRDAIGE